MPGSLRHIDLSREALERVGRVFDYHRMTKHTRESVREAPYVLDWNSYPDPNRVFEDRPPVALPRDFLTVETDTLALMRLGADALPAGQVAPRQNLQTLATWLLLAYGVTGQRQAGRVLQQLRTCPSGGGLYPCEIYVAAFAIEGLEPGLYHYEPRDFELRKLREGEETLQRLRRGRPDLEFLKTAPAALLVSTVFWRTAWKYRDRGYRMALLDAGHLVENLAITASGLGITTISRLRVNDAAMRELIGLAADVPFADAEAVHAAVIWADKAEHPIKLTGAAGGAMPSIPRPKLAGKAPAEYMAIVPTHQNCVGPGIGLIDVLPPYTELNPVPAEVPSVPVAAGPPERGLGLGEVMIERRSAHGFSGEAIPLSKLAELNWRAFRGGTFSPLRPAGTHVALVRPFWFIHNVQGMEAGIWAYNPVDDSWAEVRKGDFREQAKYLCLEQEVVGSAAAICLMVVNLVTTMAKIGPDCYRLAHLEAGIAGQRLALAATAMGLRSTGIGAFYDEDARRFLGLAQTGWELIYCTAVGAE